MSEVEPVEVFISYAPADEVLRARLEVHMSLLQRQGWIRTWHRGQVIAGQEADAVIAVRLEAARLLLLLVSARFLGSDDCYEKEMKRALERHSCGDARVVPIIAEACDWHDAPFGHLDVLPAGGKPVRSWRVQSEAWANVARGIRAVAAELAMPRALVDALRAKAERVQLSAGMLGRGVGGLRQALALEALERQELAQRSRGSKATPYAPLDEPDGWTHSETMRRFVHAAFHVRPDGPARLRQVGIPPGQQIVREREVLACLERLGSTGCVVYGRSGVGKTTFARHLAHELAPHYADMQIEIDLRGASLVPSPPEAVMAEVISVLTRQRDISRLQYSQPDLATLYASIFEHRRVLLLLDGARDAAQVEPLIPPPGSLLIVTCREQLTVPGMQTFYLDAMAPDDAHAFVRRLCPRLDEAAGHEVSNACAFLPLAIYIAACTLNAEVGDTAESIAPLQEQRERADPVEAVHLWALDRMDAPLRALWYMLSVFPADFGQEAAAAVGAMEPGAIEPALRTLVHRGLLLRNDTADRFRMQGGSGAHARSHADATLLREAARRHAEHFWGKLHMMQSDHQLSAFCDLEDASIDAAQAWAAAVMEEDDMGAVICRDLPLLPPCCWKGRQLDRSYHWAQSGMAAVKHLGGDESAYASAVRSVAQRGDMRDAPREFHEQALAHARELGNSAVEYVMLDRFADFCVKQRDWHRAILLRKEQLAVADRLGDTSRRIFVQEKLSICLDAGEPGQSLAAHEQFLASARERGDLGGEYMTLDAFARWCAKRKNWRRAIQLRSEQLDIARRLGDRERQVRTLEQLDALCRLDARGTGQALDPAPACFPPGYKVGDRATECLALDTFARWCVQQQDWSRAIELRREQLVVARQIDDRPWERWILEQLSQYQQASSVE
ncbi:TIR domain-containing protein [Sorangium sp. So ce726]|uniref:TIR domain-containing protein n=1 Tax=Sorangium sp. So ce726 TaxID=3133319 RepID=UPI003F63F4D4